MTASGNARWIALIQMSRIGVQILCVTVLSRLLAPGDFGLVAMALAVTNFGNLLRDMGVAAAVIQKPRLDSRTIATAFWMTAAVGVLLGLLFLLTAPLVAKLMQAQDLVGLLRILATIFPIYGVALVQQALLERHGQFATVARVEITSAAAGLGVALLAAAGGAGAYSLAYQSVAIAGLTSLQLLALSDWKPRASWGAREFRELWRFGSHVSGSNVISYVARNVDSVIIGRVLGAASLGPYSIAYRIMLFPLYNLAFVATRALLPVMSRAAAGAGEPKAPIVHLYLRVLSTIAFFTAPLMAGLFVLRAPFVEVFLGPRWHQVSELIVWLAPTGFVQSLITPSGSVFVALGRPDRLLKIGAAGAALMVISFLVGVQGGVVRVAQCYFIASLLSAVLWFTTTLRVLDCSPRRLFAALLRPVAMTFAMGVSVWLLALLFDPTSPRMLELGVLSVAGAALYASLALVASPSIVTDVRALVFGRRLGRAPLRPLVLPDEGVR
ncbi:MAG TPA: lipopolysaccharide biosynthesis protein [Steroidobacteraceae bacterium]|nr:lipopolysaccharide biosynthesis protein [Steroidobacteraceae bacterium]